MAQRPKAKPKSKGRKGTNTDKTQSTRFIETARKLGIDGGSDFDRVIEKLIPPRRRSPA